MKATLFALLLSAVVGLVVGDKRKIGFWWTFFFSFFFGIVIGLGLAFGSDRINSLSIEHKKKSTSLMFGFGLLIASAIVFYMAYRDVTSGSLFTQLLLFIATGLLGGAFYMFYTERRSKNAEEEHIAKQVDGLIVLTITGAFLVFLSMQNVYYPIN